MSAATVQQVTVPDIGDFDDVPVIEILVAVGDTVAAEDPLVTLESDKATMDVPSPAAGTIKAIHVKIGDSVAQGKLIVDLETEDSGSGSGSGGDEPAQESGAAPSQPSAGPSSSDASSSANNGDSDKSASGSSAASAEEGGSGQPRNGDDQDRPPAASAPAPAAASSTPASNGNGNGGPVYASPSVRRLARELGVDLHGVHGTGRKGRLTGDDVKGVKSGGGETAPASGGVPTNGSGAGLNISPWPKVDFEKWGEIQRVPRTRIQKISAPALARNWVMIPHVTQNDEADITDLEAWRKQLNGEQPKDGVKFTMVTFLVAAVVASLKEFPDFNASLDGDDLVRRKYFNIGFAADTPNGLVVPVIKNADQKSLREIAADLTELSGKARAGKLGPADITGGTFSISSLGGIGGTSFTPIINAPEVAILGATRAAIKPIWDAASETFVPRLMIPLSLSYDHRAIDGAAAARFVAHLTRVLSDLRRVLL